jgi:hypothetical protein
MWPNGVVTRHLLGDEEVDVILAEDQEMVHALMRTRRWRFRCRARPVSLAVSRCVVVDSVEAALYFFTRLTASRFK